MPVYVDDMYTRAMGRYGRMKMSHMIADTQQELLDMAYRIGVGAPWIQDMNTYKEHFDVALSKRERAISYYGAVPITLRETVFIIECKRRELVPDIPIADALKMLKDSDAKVAAEKADQ